MCLFLTFGFSQYLFAQDIPLAEHPRPDFERSDWINLNGSWAFQFDPNDEGRSQGWQNGEVDFEKRIMVPFPWGSDLSGLEDEADIGWYQRSISVSSNWQGKRTFLTIGASDWETTVWLDGHLLGAHQGGYVPFSFELTEYLTYDKEQTLIIKVDDARREFTLYGKQGYGNARGIWQTIYLEARGQNYLDAVHFTPDIDQHTVNVTAYLPSDAEQDLPLSVNIQTEAGSKSFSTTIPRGKYKHTFDIDIPSPHLWTLDDPYLYQATVSLGDDTLQSYFGMRKISVVNLPGTEYPYIALNNEPIYVQLALDQSYHPEGFYTFPSDQFMKEEIERSKNIGLNGIRTHIKVEVPRKLYWADKLGLLVMEDLPNSWGEPDAKMQAESEYTLRQMIKRDYNHPSIFSWVIFNETWGLVTEVEQDGKKERAYLPETQAWVASMYYLAKSLDLSRIVEDNSICCGRGHTETDLNSWHVYLPGYAWEEYLSNIEKNTYPGSSFDFEEGYFQGNQPNINSECGNVWGYEGSAGDVDWSWDYHRMINTFRVHPKIGGWLYTEHHDVINEWNGYWRFDRSKKETGMGEIVEGMSLNDLHAAVYLSTGNEICKTVTTNEFVTVPVFLSSMTGEEYGEELMVSYTFSSTNYIGETEKNQKGSMRIAYEAWMQKQLDPIAVMMPSAPGVGTLAMMVSDTSGKVLSRNFMQFEVVGEQNLPKTVSITAKPSDFSSAEWSKKQWNVMEGRKANGAGKGYFEYTLDLPENANKAKSAYLLLELSAKELFVKDQEEYDRNQDFMKGSRVAPSSNPNSYPMSDEVMFPSDVTILVNGQEVHTTNLVDDPADHRGTLSWHHQLKDRTLREAGSYGYMVKVPLRKGMIKAATKSGKMSIRIQTKGEGGIAVYGKEFGRYAFDPGVVLSF